jgi:DNA-binding Xre family transcriptional regulator
MASNSDNQTKTSSLQDKLVVLLKKLTARDDINALRSEIAALRAEFEMLPNGPRGRIETLQELCNRLEVRLSEVVELASQPRASERRDARIIADLERRIEALEQARTVGQ